MAKRTYSSPSFLYVTMLADITSNKSEEIAGGTSTVPDGLYDYLFGEDGVFDTSDIDLDTFLRYYPYENWGQYVKFDEYDRSTWEDVVDWIGSIVYA